MAAPVSAISPGTRSRTGKAMLPAIGDLRSLVIVCTTVERPDGDVSTIVTRPGVIKVRARVRPIRGEMFLDYDAVFETANRPRMPTHEITIRTPPDVKIDLGHWVYHCDRLAETWYRVRTVEDIAGRHRFTVMLCAPDKVRDSRSDPATQELPPTWEVPFVPEVI